MSYFDSVSIKDICVNILNAIRNLARVPIMVRSQSSTLDTVKVSGIGTSNAVTVNGLNGSGYVQVDLIGQSLSPIATSNTSAAIDNFIAGYSNVVNTSPSKILMNAQEGVLQNTRINSPLRRAIY